jgi:hypothetical protein
MSADQIVVTVEEQTPIDVTVDEIDVAVSVDTPDTVEVSVLGGFGPAADLSNVLFKSAGDFETFSEKTDVVFDDVVLIEDSEASKAKKWSKISSLPVRKSIDAAIVYDIGPTGDFLTIQDGLDALSDYTIGALGSVTLQLPAGVTLTAPITVTHPDGDKIYITGVAPTLNTTLVALVSYSGVARAYDCILTVADTTGFTAGDYVAIHATTGDNSTFTNDFECIEGCWPIKTVDSPTQMTVTTTWQQAITLLPPTINPNGGTITKMETILRTDDNTRTGDGITIATALGEFNNLVFDGMSGTQTAAICILVEGKFYANRERAITIADASMGFLAIINWTPVAIAGDLRCLVVLNNYNIFCSRTAGGGQGNGIRSDFGSFFLITANITINGYSCSGSGLGISNSGTLRGPSAGPKILICCSLTSNGIQTNSSFLNFNSITTKIIRGATTGIAITGNPIFVGMQRLTVRLCTTGVSVDSGTYQVTSSLANPCIVSDNSGFDFNLAGAGARITFVGFRFLRASKYSHRLDMITKNGSLIDTGTGRYTAEITNEHLKESNPHYLTPGLIGALETEGSRKITTSRTAPASPKECDIWIQVQ